MSESVATVAVDPSSRDEQERTHTRWHPRIVLAILIVFAFQFARAMNRHSDPDEYQFVAPPALLSEFHKLPYVDYPYFHTPNLVFVQAILMGWTSNKLLVARILSSACGTATIGLLFYAGWNLLGSLPRQSRLTLLTSIMLVFATCRLFTYTSGNAWNHDSAVLCTLAAFLLHLRGMQRGSVRCIILAGFLIGFAVGIRLSFAIAVVPLAVSAFIAPSPLSRQQRMLAVSGAVGAAAVANIPSIWLMVLAPARFIFGNIGFCTLSTAYYRSLHGQFGMSFFGKIGSSLSKFITDPCNLAILIAFGFAVFFRFSRRDRTLNPEHHLLCSQFDFTLGMIACLWLGAMGPTPMMQQYNYMYVPFMILAIFYGLRLIKDDAAMLRRVQRITAITAVVLGGSGLVRWYWSIVYLPTPSHWQPMVQHREAEWIRRMTRPRARILTIESEIPLEAGLMIYPEYATGRFVLLVEKFASPEMRNRYGLIGPAELPKMLAARPPDAVFVRTNHGCDRPFVDYAKTHHYIRVTAPDGSSTLWLSPR